MTAADHADQYDEMRKRWEQAARGWSRRADSIQEFGLRVSVWMVERLDLQPGQVVLELAAGPGDTGFLAAELIRPGGTLISSDASRSMLAVATARARKLEVPNVDFRVLELEWIDLETASVDAALCRWGLMFAPDPEASLREVRRVLKPGGKVALAVWDDPDENPWATIPTRALVELGFAQPPDPTAPGMFRLADAEGLRELLESAGFVDIGVDRVRLSNGQPDVAHYIASTLDLSAPFAETRTRLSKDQWSEVEERIATLAAPYSGPDGSLQLPGRSLVAAAGA